MSWNFDDFLHGLNSAGGRGEKAAMRAVEQFGSYVLGKAQQLAPIDTGALKNSATAEPAVRKLGGIEETIGFNTDYAAAVHERLNVHHNQGQAKYLEKPIRTEDHKFLNFIRDQMKKEL